jgi:ferredoxin-NADP reductase
MAVQMLTGEVISKSNLTKDVIQLSMQVPEFDFKAGQFITMKLPNGDKILPRSYSILSPPSQRGKLDFAIKLVEDGQASAIFDKMKLGTQIPFMAPLGHFVFVPGKKHCFLGAGTGVAPLYCMVKEHLANLPQQEFHLIAGYRKKDNALFHDEFSQMDKKYANFIYQLVLSRESGEFKGHVQDFLPENLTNTHFYICGLKELVMETKAILLERGVSPELIHFERYN